MGRTVSIRSPLPQKHISTKLRCHVKKLKHNTYITEAFVFGYRQLKVTEMDGRAGVQKRKRETARKRSAGAADDQDFQKSPVQKKRNICPSKRTGGLTGTKKSLPLSHIEMIH